MQKIDFDEIIKEKNPRLAKYLPKFIKKFIKKIICQDDINDFIERNGHLQGVEFSESLIKYLNFRVNVIGKEKIPENGKYVFVANHPLGGLDGLALVSEIGKKNRNVKILVNDLLRNIENLNPVFIHVNKHGRNPQEYARAIDEAYASDDFIITFPAGFVSRRKKGVISDIKWQKNFLKKAITHGRDIIPIHIEAQNSKLFYIIANIRKALGIKVNIEMFLLPHELFKQRNKSITLRIGEPISNEMFDKSLSLDEWAEIVRGHVYALFSGGKLPLATKQISKIRKDILKTYRVHKGIKPIIEPIAKDLIESELTKDKYLRKTNKGNNSIYIVTEKDSPNVMKELGRIREISYREANGGTGREVDIDKYDTDEPQYKQLIIWDFESKEIIGGYRFMLCNQVDKYNYEEKLATSELFKFSNNFIDNYLPYTIELGRSFIQPLYQSTKSSRKSIFALDNLWDGLGALMINYPEMKYFFGKMTMFKTFDPYSRDLILYFLNKHFPDNDNLVVPKRPLFINTDEKIIKEVLTEEDYDNDYKLLGKAVRSRGETIPPLFSSYMNISSTMKTFGSSLNDTFGEVEETGILVTMSDIFEEKKERHVNTYLNEINK